MRNLDARLRRLERPRTVANMTNAELCTVIAAGTGKTPRQVAAMTNDELMALAEGGSRYAEYAALSDEELDRRIAERTAEIERHGKPWGTA